MTFQHAPRADNFAPHEAVPKGKIPQIPAAGQDGGLNGVAVVAAQCWQFLDFRIIFKFF